MIKKKVYFVEMWSRENPLVVSTQLSEGALRSKEAGERQPEATCSTLKSVTMS